ncbi:hypothetical protein ACIQ1J_31125 [Streptomyces sp. NPDC097107]|uniref:hypothetical protein n=1 Tax=Streptomyces sp. NPDC097107 TaxID=3366089 RepID=UPI00380E86EE
MRTADGLGSEGRLEHAPLTAVLVTSDGGHAVTDDLPHAVPEEAAPVEDRVVEHDLAGKVRVTDNGHRERADADLDEIARLRATTP